MTDLGFLYEASTVHKVVTAAEHMQLQANGNYHCHPRSHAWLLVKQVFVSNDVATFLE